MNCPTCLAEVAETSIVVPHASLQPPRKQVEPYVRITKWQCLRDKNHQGRYERACENPVPGDST